jgi:hypothetical protein
VIHRKPPCRAFGAAQYSSANIRLISTSSTGHLAKLHSRSGIDPAPSAVPTASASRPVKTTMTTLTTSITPMRTVTPRRIGSVFHSGRPSGTS